jgi:hypothetical protein
VFNLTRHCQTQAQPFAPGNTQPLPPNYAPQIRCRRSCYTRLSIRIVHSQSTLRGHSTASAPASSSMPSRPRSWVPVSRTRRRPSKICARPRGLRCWPLGCLPTIWLVSPVLMPHATWAGLRPGDALRCRPPAPIRQWVRRRRAMGDLSRSVRRVGFPPRRSRPSYEVDRLRAHALLGDQVLKLSDSDRERVWRSLLNRVRVESSAALVGLGDAQRVAALA